MLMYQAKIQHVTDASRPDDYDLSSGQRPPPNFVISRNAAGETLSVYGDVRWDRTPYDPDGKTNIINFQFWTDEEQNPARSELREEIRWLIFLVIYTAPVPLADQSIRRYLTLLRVAARQAELKAVGVMDLITDPHDFPALVSISHAKTARALLALLHKLGPSVSGYTFKAFETIKSMQKLINQYSASLKQTVPIPTRIYSLLLGRMSEELNSVEPYFDNILALLRDYCSDPAIGLAVELQRAIGRTPGKISPRNTYKDAVTFPDLLRRHGLDQFWADRSFRPNGKQLTAFLTRVQHIASLTIQAFTGMRGEEVDTLPYFCLEEQKRYGDDRVHYIVRGKVTKDGGDARPVQWITSRSGRAAIILAQRLASTIYDILGIKLTPKNTGVDFHLFVRVTSVLIRTVAPKPIELDVSSNKGARGFLAIPIEERDIIELESIDTSRAWRQEPTFQVGQPWPVRRHQLRRSLALYAQKSGLVSLPALKRQLQHITEEMTLYYCAGSPFAKDFIGEGLMEKHFGHEWQEVQPVSMGLSYIKNVLMDFDDKFGPLTLWLHQHGRADGAEILIDRDMTMKAMRKGQLSYRPTPIGGCSKTSRCETLPISTLHTECMTSLCKHMVGSVAKVERLIDAKSAQVEKLKSGAPMSFEYKVENAELEALRAGLARGKEEIRKRNLPQ
jgi:hypothetical protein